MQTVCRQGESGWQMIVVQWEGKWEHLQEEKVENAVLFQLKMFLKMSYQFLLLLCVIFTYQENDGKWISSFPGHEMNTKGYHIQTKNVHANEMNEVHSFPPPQKKNKTSNNFSLFGSHFDCLYQKTSVLRVWWEAERNKNISETCGDKQLSSGTVLKQFIK